MDLPHVWSVFEIQSTPTPLAARGAEGLLMMMTMMRALVTAAGP
jgi:hypothetical protein